MAKAPAFQFYVKDWLSDPLLRQATPLSRGIWIDVLCYMWMMPDQSGRLETTLNKLARLTCSGNLDEARHFINDLWDLGFGDLECDEDLTFPLTEENNNTDITLINRRMYNDYLNRKGGRERQAKYREKGGGDPAHWTAILIKILKRDESMCAYCGRKADTVDHVIPKTKGGNESDENLVACCKRCNMKKGNRTLKDAGMSFWKGYLKLKHQNNTDNNTKITPSSPSTTTTTTPKQIHPEWLNLPLWKEFKKYRTKIKAPLTDHAEKLCIADLKKRIDEGYDQIEIVNQTIMSGKWKSFFAVKGKTGTSIKSTYNFPECGSCGAKASSIKKGTKCNYCGELA